MVVFVDRTALQGPSLLLLGLLAQLVPAVAQNYPLLDGRGRPDDVYHTFSDPTFKFCRSAACEGIRDVWDLMDLMDHRDIPNSLARLSPPPANERQVIDRKIERRLFAHPNRWPTYCQVVVSLARDVDSRGAEGPYYMLHALEIVARLRSPTFDCTRKAVDLLPRTEEFAEEVRLLWGECLDVWHHPYCEELCIDVPGKSVAHMGKERGIGEMGR